MTKTYQLGENLDAFRPIVGRIKNNLREFAYDYMAQDEFMKLVLNPKTIPQANRIYAQEILFRAHSAAISTILRNDKWIQGIEQAIEASNFQVFCASLRGLLEAATDSVDAFQSIPLSIATYAAEFRQALDGDLSRGMMCCEDLENELIHYSYGQRIEKGKDAPDSHRAKPNTAYIATIDCGGTKVRDLYAEFCQMAHPAAPTIHQFFVSPDGNTEFGRRILKMGHDTFLIESVCQRHADATAMILQGSFNSAFVTLVLLNSFSDERIHTEGIEESDVRSIPVWDDIEAALRSQEAR